MRWITVCLAASLWPAVLAGEVRLEKLFGEETRTGPYKHPSSITQLSNGDLYVVYFGGGGEYADATAVFGSRLAKGKWSAPMKIASDPVRPLGNAVIWQAPGGTVWLFYVVRYGETWSSSRIEARQSRDGARTWTKPEALASEPGMMVRNRPIVLADGNYLLPVYHEVGDDKESVGAGSTSRFLRYSVKDRRWSEAGVIRSPRGNIQPAVAELEPGRLIAFCRRGGGYGPTADGWMVRSESSDGGVTWAEGRDADLPNPNSAVDLIRLRSGLLLLVYNHSMSERTPLRAALSSDGGRTWPRWVDLESGRDSYAYPFVIQDTAGTIRVVYTSRGRKQVNLATFTEEDISAPASRP